MKKTWIAGLSVLAVLATASAAYTAQENYKANAETTDILAEITPAMAEGASVRLEEGSNGLRFQMKLTAEEYQAAEALNAEYGMLILPADYAAENAVTVENVFSESAKYYFANEAAVAGKKPIINLTANDLTLSGGEYVLNGSIVNILDKNVVRPFMGVGYVAAEKEGATYYKLAEENDNVRSIAYVAQAALESGKYEASEEVLTGYVTKASAYQTNYTVVHNVEGKDGKFTEKSREVKTAAIASTLTAEDVKTEIEGYTYQSMTAVDSVLADGKTVVNVYYEDDAKQTYSYASLGEHKVAVNIKKVSGENVGLLATWKPTTTEGLVGYGISFSLTNKVYHYIYHIGAGTVSRLEGCLGWDWGSAYKAPAEYGLTVTTNADGSVSILFPFAALSESASVSGVNLCLFNYVDGVAGAGVKYGYADCMAVDGVYSDFTNPATYDRYSIYAEAGESVLSTYNVAAFGKTNATAKLEKVSGTKSGIRVTFTYTPSNGLFGFGVILSDGVSGIRQLFAVGFGTIDHNVYGNWSWGNYVTPDAVGVEGAEGTVDEKNTVTLFYSYETLAEYGLNITAATANISFTLFEYVDDGTGSYLDCYNGMKNELGAEILVDCGVTGLVKWDTTKA